jgi:hypothetical protein
MPLLYLAIMPLSIHTIRGFERGTKSPFSLKGWWVGKDVKWGGEQRLKEDI